VNGTLLPKRIGLGKTGTMIALTAEELSVPLFLLSSIRDIALRFFFEYIRITLGRHKTFTQLHVLQVLHFLYFIVLMYTKHAYTSM